MLIVEVLVLIGAVIVLYGLIVAMKAVGYFREDRRRRAAHRESNSPSSGDRPQSESSSVRPREKRNEGFPLVG